MAMDAKQLLKMSQQELDALFSAHDAGPIPDGEAKGTAIIAPGTYGSEKIAEFINIFAWQGKVFDAKAGLLETGQLARLAGLEPATPDLEEARLPTPRLFSEENLVSEQETSARRWPGLVAS